jgi:hypothetical protein
MAVVLYSRNIFPQKRVVTNLVLAYLQNYQFFGVEVSWVIHMDEAYFHNKTTNRRAYTEGGRTGVK